MAHGSVAHLRDDRLSGERNLIQSMDVRLRMVVQQFWVTELFRIGCFEYNLNVNYSLKRDNT